MKILAIVVISVTVIYHIVLLATMAKGKKLFPTMLITALSGIAVLVAINSFTALLNINGWTLGVSASFGVPGIIAMLAAKFFF
ncbi:MAG: pro-sigmaK processing inhibitor BofA family protein [Clostridia bacterium]|nr:pro-sigmaK processing inhibitor BofA family protein [Clostridia bacterium]